MHSLLLTSTVTRFDTSITGHSTASKLQIARGMVSCMHDAIHSTRLAFVIYGITSARRMCEVRPVVLIRESSTQLLIYSLDIYMRQTLYILTNFQVSERP